MRKIFKSRKKAPLYSHLAGDSTVSEEANRMIEEKQPLNRKIARQYYRRKIRRDLGYTPGDLT